MSTVSGNLSGNLSGPLSGQRCANHFGREAAVRCPGCQGFFCRECVTEHEHRMMCAPCVSKKNIARAAGQSGGFVWAVLSAGGLLIAWLLFYYTGVGLASLPSSFFGGPSPASLGEGK